MMTRLSEPLVRPWTELLVALRCRPTQSADGEAANIGLPRLGRALRGPLSERGRGGWVLEGSAWVVVHIGRSPLNEQDGLGRDHRREQLE
jgi:hypothetical protein